jgi:hypothetical protein
MHVGENCSSWSNARRMVSLAPMDISVWKIEKGNRDRRNQPETRLNLFDPCLA